MTATLTRSATPATTGCALLLADLPGYTDALHAMAAAHGAAVVAFSPPVMGLLDGVVAGLVPPYRLGQREGDRVVLYGPDGVFGARGDEVLDTLSYCYAEFRRRRNEATASMNCDCQACAGLRRLELRFVLHWGDYRPGLTMAQLLAHGGVADHAYALVTKPAAEHLDIPVNQPASYLSAVRL